MSLSIRNWIKAVTTQHHHQLHSPPAPGTFLPGLGGPCKPASCQLPPKSTCFVSRGVQPECHPGSGWGALRDQPRHCRWPSFRAPSEPRELTLLLAHAFLPVSPVTHVTCFWSCCTFLGPCCFGLLCFGTSSLASFPLPCNAHHRPLPSAHTHTCSQASSSFSLFCVCSVVSNSLQPPAL